MTARIYHMPPRVIAEAPKEGETMTDRYDGMPRWELHVEAEGRGWGIPHGGGIDGAWNSGAYAKMVNGKRWYNLPGCSYSGSGNPPSSM